MIKILHLEDLESDADIIKREIRKSALEFEIKIADSKESYLELLESYQPDIILSDHSLPMFDSKEALELLHQFNKNIPFILVTAKMSEEFAVDTMKRGAYDYVLKDRLQRLPGAIKNAYDKSKIEKENKLILDKVIENEKLFRQIQGLARFGICITDIETMKSSWTDELFDLFEYSHGDEIPSIKSMLKRMNKKDAAHAEYIYNLAIQSKQNQKFNFEILDSKGRTNYLKSEIFVQEDPKLSKVNIISFIQDITQMELYKKSAQKTEANLNALFENTSTGYIMLDKNGLILSLNNAGIEWAKYELKTNISTGVLYSDYLITPEQKKRFEDKKSKTLKGEKVHFETMYTDEYGNFSKWYRITSFPVHDTRNRIVGFCLSIVDNTDHHLEVEVKKQMTEDLILRNKNLEQFAYIVSHNLRAPVANIIGFADFLKNRDLLKNEQEEVFTELERAVVKLDNVIRDLNMILQVNRKIEESREWINLNEMLEDITQSIQMISNDSSFKIKADFSAINSIKSIRSYIYSIIYNMITNAYKYRNQSLESFIEIKSQLINNQMQLTFKDNGIGIDLVKNKDQIFGLYKRFSTTIEGKGVGLFMVKTQVESLKGKISVNSEPGIGTEFIIELPMLN